MGYSIYKLSNVSCWSGETATISIDNTMDGWSLAYQNWLSGKPPTNSKEWQKGVFAHSIVIPKLESLAAVV